MWKRSLPCLNRVVVDNTASIQLYTGKVVAVGSGTRGRNGNLIPVGVNEGEIILSPDYWGMEVHLAEKEIHTYLAGPSQAFYAKGGTTLSTDLRHGVGTCYSTHFISRRCIPLPKSCCQSASFFSNFSSGDRCLSSLAGKESSEVEDNLEDGFSELESPTSDFIEKTGKEEIGGGLVSEPELSGDEELEDTLYEVSSNDTESGSIGEVFPLKKSGFDFTKVILNATHSSLSGDLNKWEKENSLDRSEISLAMLNLRKRRMYAKALQFSEWLEVNKKSMFTERDYGSRLDLIAKLHGLYKAKKYIENIPASFRGELVYRTLLANYVITLDVKKVEQVFNKMRESGFEMSSFVCNQMILLYKRVDKRKIADILCFMEKENIKLNLFTFRLLIDTKGQVSDITGMEQCFETMKEQGIKPDIRTIASLAKHYIHGGFNEKAHAILKEMEGGNLKENRRACQFLLPLYADINMVDDVGRVWKVCDQKPRLEECLAAIEAYGKLGKVKEAEEVFESMSQTGMKISLKSFNKLLQVYANHKMFAKGKELVKRMSDSGCHIGPWTVDALVKLYVDAGEVEKADSILNKAVQQNKTRPLFSSYMQVMDQYAKRGDIHNAEKIFHRMKQSCYVSRLRQYQALLDTYIKAKAPAYGFRERMKADEVFPNKVVASKLVQVDAFRKTTISELLD